MSRTSTRGRSMAAIRRRSRRVANLLDDWQRLTRLCEEPELGIAVNPKKVGVSITDDETAGLTEFLSGLSDAPSWSWAGEHVPRLAENILATTRSVGLARQVLPSPKAFRLRPSAVPPSLDGAVLLESLTDADLQRALDCCER